MRIRIGTRGSKLALWQANYVKGRIEEELRWEVELVKIKTKGDKITDVPLAKVGGKGLFVKEIEEALLDGRIDIAVHSLKDMPSVLPEGLEIIAVTEREEPWDVLVSKEPLSFDELSTHRVGTSSLRRTAQLKHFKPEVAVLPLRGNLDTRLRKLSEGEFDAIIVALAGLKRLGVVPEHFFVLDNFIPAIGQGALAVEARAGAFPEIRSILNCDKTEIEVKAERAFLETIGGSCQVPVGAFGRLDGGRLYLKGFIAHPEGSPFYEDEISGAPEKAYQLGITLARALLERGGSEVVKELGL